MYRLVIKVYKVCSTMCLAAAFSHVSVRGGATVAGGVSTVIAGGVDAERRLRRDLRK